MAVHDPSASRELLEVLTALLTEVPVDAPVAVGVRVIDHGEAHEREVELFFRHLDCTDVVHALAGLVAPADWQAFGVVAPGQGLRLDDDGRHDGGPAIQVVACALVDRSGHVVSQVRDSQGDELAVGPTDGRVVDACRRVLRLPTAPAVGAPAMWATVAWVDTVLARTLAADLGCPPGWADLVALDVAAPVPPPAWPALRAACAAGLLTVPGVSPQAAAWMDDGMFARELFASLPPLFEMLTDLRELLAPTVFDRVVARVSDRLAA